MVYFITIPLSDGFWSPQVHNPPFHDKNCSYKMEDLSTNLEEHSFIYRWDIN